MSNLTKGVLLVLLASFSLAMMSFFFKLIGENISSYEKLVARGILLLVVSLYLIHQAKRKNPSMDVRYLGKPKNIPLLIARSAFGALSMLCNIYSLNNLSLADADMIFKLNSVFLILLSAIFLKEKVTYHQIIAVFVCVIALFFITKPSFDNPNLLAYGVAFLGMILAALAYVVIRYLTTSSTPEHPSTIMANLSVFILCTMIWPTVIHFKGFEGQGLNYIYLTLASIFSALGQLSFTFSFKFAPAKETSIYNYSSLIYNSILGYLVFNAIPDTYSVIGYILIVLASVYLYSMNLIQNKRSKRLQMQG